MKFPATLLFLLLSTLAFSQKNVLPDDVITSIQSKIDLGLTPSIVVGIIDKYGSQYYSFGTKTFGGKPVDEHTIYEIGSISKVFTATMLANNIVKGRMKAEDPIAKHLPSAVKVPVYSGGGGPITLGNLSDHTSSIQRMPSNMPVGDPTNPAADYTVDLMYEFLSSYALPREVGSEFEYSNIAVGLLGHIQALAAGMSYEDLLLKLITAPLKMNETAITFSDKMKANLAIGHAMGTEVNNWDLNAMQGAGAIRSSVHDMLIFLSANMGLTKSSLLSAMQLAQTQRHNKAGQGVGLGWFIASGSEGNIYMHNGGTGGYRTFAGFDKESGKGVVVFTNSGTLSVDDIGLHLLDPQSPLEEAKPDYSFVLKQMIDKDGASGLVEKYKKLKTDSPGKYVVNEDAINTLGYYYLSEANLEAALAVFNINVMEHPASSNVYDSYGEALMKNGQQAEAILNYLKSLELNPGNANAAEMLAKMGVEVKTEEYMVEQAILESYAGEYELAPGFTITVTRDQNHLFCQATGQSKFQVYAKSNTEFYLKVVEATVVFDTNAAGVVGMTLHQGGQAMPGRKIK